MTLGEGVCPECGAPAGDQPFCAASGKNLASVERLPTRAEWEVGKTSAAEAEQGNARSEPNLPSANTDDAGASIGWRLGQSLRTRRKRYIAATALIACIAVVLVIVTYGGGGLNPSRVAASLQAEYASTSGDSSVTWSCNVGQSGDPSWPGLGCEADVNGFSGTPYYEVASNGGNCFTATAAQAANQDVDVSASGLRPASSFATTDRAAE